MERKLSTKVLTIVLTIVCAFGVFGCKHNTVPETPSRWEQGDHTLDSAYEQATRLGYTGSLDEFLNAIQGKDGVGIESVELNDDGELVVRDTNGKILLQEKIPTCKHSYGYSVAGLTPTCTSAGYNFRICSKCGDKDYEVLAATGHRWDEGTTALEPDCTRNGLRLYTCTVCGQTKVEILYATNEHRFEDGFCVYCRISFAQAVDQTYNGDYGYTYLLSLSNGTELGALYNAIHKQVMRFHNDASANATDDTYALCEIDYTDYGLTVDQAVSVWKTYLDDKPLYYWISKTLSMNGTNIVLKVDDAYAQGAARAAYNEKLYKILDEYSAMAAGESAYSVALKYHDTIINGIDYAYKSGDVPQDAAWAHNITGVFDGQGAVCEGYARAFQLLLNMRGIENVFVTGKSRKQSHAWNLARLDDGNWYWYDLTWDDTPNYYWGVRYDYACATDGEFLKSHTPDRSDEFGVEFLYDLPARSTSDYDGKEIKRMDTFSYKGADYVVEGYDTVSLSTITADGVYRIPETVPYRGREFTVVSLMHYAGGKPVSVGILQLNTRFESVVIPSTVLYIDDGAFRQFRIELQSIAVDEANPRFCSQDGVLFSANLFMLIAYPMGNKRKAYAVPDQTHCIAQYAFFNECEERYLESLHIGKSVVNVGYANWGNGYSENSFRNLIAGEWRDIVESLTGAQTLTVDAENRRYVIQDNMLFNYGKTVVETALAGIETAIIPETVQRVEIDAFRNCQTLKKVVFQAEDVDIRSSAFDRCGNLEEVVLPTGLKEIESRTFSGCRALKSITIPDTVTSIGENAFNGCRSLTSVHIPASVRKIEKMAFAGCPLLTEITVDPENAYYTDKGNCIIEVATRTLMQGCAGSVIPDDGSVTTIAEGAFYESNIAEIVVPDGVTTIGRYAFLACTKLKTIVLPASLTSIGVGADLNVFHFDVFYKGTQADWDALEKNGSFTSYEYNHLYIYFYTEEQPSDDGNYWHYVNDSITKW